MHGYAQFLNHKGRPIHKGANYFAAYERHFGPYINRPITFLEIGAGNGGSSEFWKGYFGPLARIITLDINPACKEFEDEQVAVRIGDQADTAFLQSVLDEFGAPDLILDDGSHVMEHVHASFDYLYPRMNRNGVYMIEDMHTAYWNEYGGGYRSPSSFAERFKGFVDDINVRFIRDNDGSAKDLGAYCISAYESIFVVEKSSYINTKMTLLGDSSRRVNMGAA